MRDYLCLNPRQGVALSPEELDTLDALMQQVTQQLHIDEQAERNEIAARILSLYAIGRSPEEILDLSERLYRQGFTPGGRRSDKPTPTRIRTERQRRWLAKKKA
jgi:hypothetical protein